MKTNKDMTKVKEVWKDILGFEGRYKISNLGRVKSMRRTVDIGERRMPNGARMHIYRHQNEKILKCIIKRDYYYVFLSNLSIRKYFSIHRLVAMHFIPNSKNKPEVNHIDGIKSNNSKSNLEWATVSENALHAFKIGLRVSQKGEDSHAAKITNIQALKIRNSKELGTILAAKYGIGVMQISRIKRGLRWAHLNAT